MSDWMQGFLTGAGVAVLGTWLNAGVEVLFYRWRRKRERTDGERWRRQ